MKYDSHYSAAVLIPMAIWGGMLPAQAADSNTPDDTKKSETATANDDETMVVTAAAQTLPSAGVSSITAEEIRKHPPARDVSELIRTQPASTSPATPPAASAVITARSIFAAWGRRTR